MSRGSLVSRGSLLLCGFLLLLGSAGCTAPTGGAPVDDERSEPPSPVFLGEATIPAGTLYEGHQIGGLSGLARVSESDYVAVSDGRGRFGPLRVYRLQLDLADGRLDDGDVEVVGWSRLRRADDAPATDAPLTDEITDLEGIVVAPDGTLLISTEGDADAGIPPCIARFDRSGELIEVIEVPDKLVPRPAEGRGVRFNLGLESLTVAPGGELLYTATENALVQDGPAADHDHGSPVRILVYDLIRREWTAEYVYRVEPVHARPREEDTYRGAGLAELLALESGDLLALERSYVDGVGMSVKLFRVDLGEADDVSDRDALSAEELDGIRPVAKTLLLDSADFPPLDHPVDNLEAIAFAPAIPGGPCPLLLMSDDNFNPDAQVSQFLAFGFHDLECPMPPPD